MEVKQKKMDLKELDKLETEYFDLFGNVEFGNECMFFGDYGSGDSGDNDGNDNSWD